MHLVLPDGVVVQTVVTVTGTVVGGATGVVTGGVVGAGAGGVVGVGAGAGVVGDGDGADVTGTVVATLGEPDEVLEVFPVDPTPGDEGPEVVVRPPPECVVASEVCPVEVRTEEP